jgi:hypothetical protein
MPGQTDEYLDSNAVTVSLSEYCYKQLWANHCGEESYLLGNALVVKSFH